MGPSTRASTISALAAILAVAPLSSKHSEGQVRLNPPAFLQMVPSPALKPLSIKAQISLGIDEQTVAMLVPVEIIPEISTALRTATLMPAGAQSEAMSAELMTREHAESLAEAIQPTTENFPGAVEVAVARVAASTQWQHVLEDSPDRLVKIKCAVEAQTQDCFASPWLRWNDLLRRLSGLTGEERLQLANEGINALIKYAPDEEIYGVSDHWATLEESVNSGWGDCEDIAIVKMWLLKSAGVDLSTMRLVVLKDTLRNVQHAVLSVADGGHLYVLDNMSWKVGRAEWMRGYRPIYALSSSGSWIYGMRAPDAVPRQVTESVALVQ